VYDLDIMRIAVYFSFDTVILFIQNLHFASRHPEPRSGGSSGGELAAKFKIHEGENL